MENQILSYDPSCMNINDGNGVSPVKTVQAGYSPSGLVRFDFVYLVGITETRKSFKIDDAGFLREMLEYFLNTTNHGKIHTQRFQFDFYEGERKKRIFFRRDKNLDNILIKFDRKTRVTLEVEDLKELTEFVASVEKALSKREKAMQEVQKMAKLYIKHHGDIDPVEHVVTAPFAGRAIARHNLYQVI